jgi:hypothetical protein
MTTGPWELDSTGWCPQSDEFENQRAIAALPDLVKALKAYMKDDECSLTPDAPDFKPGPHKICRLCDAIAALAKVDIE